jgi:serine/threonine-protein kinase
MKRACLNGAAALLVLMAAAGAARADQYAAIAYSQSTGAIGWSYGCCSQAEAEDLALQNCDGDDAQIVTWARNAYCAIALGDDDGAYGAAWGVCQAEAERRALAECGKSTTGCYIARWVFSGE